MYTQPTGRRNGDLPGGQATDASGASRGRVAATMVGMTESRRQRTSRPTAEQKAAREGLAASREKELARKKRTRELITMGGILAAHGFTKPEQVDELMAALAKRESWVGWLREKQGVDLGTTE